MLCTCRAYRIRCIRVFELKFECLWICVNGVRGFVLTACAACSPAVPLFSHAHGCANLSLQMRLIVASLVVCDLVSACPALVDPRICLRLIVFGSCVWLVSGTVSARETNCVCRGAGKAARCKLRCKVKGGR